MNEPFFWVTLEKKLIMKQKKTGNENLEQELDLENVELIWIIERM